MILKDKEKEKLSNYQKKYYSKITHITTKKKKKNPKHLINYNTDPLSLYSSSLNGFIYQYK